MTTTHDRRQPLPEGSRLAGKVAIITGGARGIGAATARLFVRHGAKVIITDVREAEGQAVADELSPHARFLRADVCSETDWQRVVTAARELGPISILVNNAAVLLIAKLQYTAQPQIEKILRTNLMGPLLGIKAVMGDMIAAGAGSIINMGSEDGLVGQDIGLSAYSATKWGIRGITKTAAMELGSHGIRVNCVHPNGGNPQMCEPYLPAGVDATAAQIGHVHELLAPPRGQPRADGTASAANMILFLASDESTGCTAGDYPVDGGYTSGRRINFDFPPPPPDALMS